MAREQGFPSWPKLRAVISQTNLDSWELVQEFVTRAVSNRKQPVEIMARAPLVVQGCLYPALVLGDAAAVELVL